MIRHGLLIIHPANAVWQETTTLALVAARKRLLQITVDPIRSVAS